MDAQTVLDVVKKGISIATGVWENRDLALKAINIVQDFIEKPAAEITLADIQAVETDLDAMLDEFNSPLPEEAP